MSGELFVSVPVCVNAVPQPCVTAVARGACWWSWRTRPHCPGSRRLRATA